MNELLLLSTPIFIWWYKLPHCFLSIAEGTLQVFWRLSYIFQNNLFHIYKVMRLSLQYKNNLCWISGFIQSKMRMFIFIVLAVSGYAQFSITAEMSKRSVSSVSSSLSVAVYPSLQHYLCTRVSSSTTLQVIIWDRELIQKWTNRIRYNQK